MSWDDVVERARRGEGPLRHARAIRRSLRGLHLPIPSPLSKFLYAERQVRMDTIAYLLQACYREPLLRSRCEQVGERLRLEGAIPLIYGNGRIRLGADVTIGGRNTWVVGFKVSEGPELIVGNRTDINYQTYISVAKRVVIGDDVMIASNVEIHDNPSHPLDPGRRRRHESFALEEAAAVTIGNNVWVAGGARILKGVTIGDNSVVAAGAIVTRSVPPNSLVAGVPARVVKQLDEEPFDG